MRGTQIWGVLEYPMKIVQAEHLLSIQNQLGEGPFWHPLEKRLYWVDIENGKIYRYSPSTGEVQFKSLGSSVGALGFCENGQMILACGKGFAKWCWDTENLDVIVDPIGDQPNVRLNDGRVDSMGRFWAGGLDRKGKAELYRLDRDLTCHTVLTNIKTSNGLAWSPDDKIFYYTDTSDYCIYTFDFEADTGEINNRRVFIRLPQDRSDGVPDGLTIDAEGFIWGAHWDGKKVTRYDPQGNAVLEVQLPVSRVTSCTFGGADFSDLYITTAHTGLSSEQRKEEPLAGDLFIYHSNTKGLPASFFRG